jgi:hypothetical protein
MSLVAVVQLPLKILVTPYTVKIAANELDGSPDSNCMVVRSL